ncbi:Semialdehyde dehydrogenase family protein [Hibiscus syriacus]|uniref:RNA-dependent RNA polymerase n=1 Tax=Hibiscus syriacus TaxID=106335 RepID=A0A6A2X2V5_HIBSY|nr:Semialdehyde dehydrogenase family protein [Hibiscus syriacus]
MFASKPGFTTESIQEKTSHSHVIRNVAKYATRLSQFLSSSWETLQVRQNEIEIIPDLEVEIGETKYNFSDGILMGCLDETGTLDYEQVFVQYSNPKSRHSSSDSLLTFNNRQPNRNCHIVEGKVAIAKNPFLHPRDLWVLHAVDVVVLHHMVDCIVFSQKGPRPHPNECSGSDLDGDLYFIFWDEDLIPPYNFPPMDYRAEQSAPLDRDVTIEDVAKYFTNYILNDNLGVITSAHTVRLHIDEYPDFMEKPGKLTYDSQSVIGRLYRKVKNIKVEVNTVKHFTRSVEKLFYDPDMEFEGYLAHINDALHYKQLYDHKLANLMLKFGIKTEAKIIIECVLKLSKYYDRRVDLDNIIEAVKSPRKEAKVSSSAEDKFAKSFGLVPCHLSP